MRRLVSMILAGNRSCKLAFQSLKLVRLFWSLFCCFSLSCADALKMKYVAAEFGSELRRRTVTDQLLRITEMNDYVIIILILELAVMLIEKDMRVYNQKTRQILQESARLE